MGVININFSLFLTLTSANIQSKAFPFIKITTKRCKIWGKYQQTH